MNTRLQVEHPVTEMITGIDLVKEQINVACGNKLSFKQEELKIIGHAIEIRVCAEDPANDFLPDIGKLITYSPPKGPGVRVDDGMEEGMEIPIYYDPMIAKLVAYGSTRTESIQRMIRAIDEYTIVGVQTTLEFCRFVMEHPAFVSGKFDTHFVSKHFKPEMLKREQDNEEQQMIAAISAIHLLSKKEKKGTVIARNETNSHTNNNDFSNWRKRREA
jgi:acetyl-CoA carboxylase, biotin carboxylase subunit